MHYFFITGTSQGIGKALAKKALQQDNASVTGFSRNQTLQHPRYQHIRCDLSDIKALKENVHSFFPEVRDAQRIVLINNAGTTGDVHYVGHMADQQIEILFNLNVIAPALLMNHFIAAYQQYDAEKIIINVSSGAGKYPVDGWSGYCASKAALDMYSQVASLEQQKLSARSNSSIKIFALAPGVVDTAMQDHIRKADASHFSTLDKFLDLKKNGQLDDAAHTAEKFFYLIDHSDSFDEVLQDVRRL